MKDGPRRGWTGAVPRRFGWIIGAALLLLLVFLLRAPLLSVPARFLDVGEPPDSADVIFLLNGGLDTRPVAAADLYRAGYADRIVVARIRDNAATRMGVFPNETDAAVEMLHRLGVPHDAVTVIRSPDGVASTADEAAVLRDFIRASPVEHVLVVTSGYHTRRARWLLRRYLGSGGPSVTMYGVAEAEFDSRNWWRVEAGVLRHMEEYMKFIHNWIYRRSELPA